MNAFAFVALGLLCQLASATHCDSSAGSCAVSSQDETSLIQTKQIVKQHGKANGTDEKTPVLTQVESKVNAAGAVDASGKQLPTYVMAGSPYGGLPYGGVAGYTPGLAPNPTDYHYNQVTIQSQVSPGNEDPRRAAAKAAEMEEHAERAMEDAVWKAQQEERAAMFASKRAAAFRAAAEKASAAENAAARAQISAADALENSAVRQAAMGRTHARVAAYKAVVQQATAYQAAADQTFAAQRAAAARTAAQNAQNGLHSMQEDTQASDYQFNDRDARKGARHRYHNAMDEISYDRTRFRDQDEDQDYDTDEDQDYHGHGRRHGAAASSCVVGDMVSATYAGDGRQYRAKISAINGDSFTLGWLDGFGEGTIVQAAQAWKAGVACGAAAAVAPMMGMAPGMGAAPGMGMGGDYD